LQLRIAASLPEARRARDAAHSGSAKSKQLARLHWSRFPLLKEVIFLHAVIPSEVRNLSSIVAGFDLGCPLHLPLDSSLCVDGLVGENKIHCNV
jgi:hypothetical protein